LSVDSNGSIGDQQLARDIGGKREEREGDCFLDINACVCLLTALFAANNVQLRADFTTLLEVSEGSVNAALHCKMREMYNFLAIYISVAEKRACLFDIIYLKCDVR
jgi:hypothetical protein